MDAHSITLAISDLEISVKITADQLRQNYARKDTEELLDIRARNQLTEVAHAAIEDELNARGVSKAAISIVLEQQAATQAAKEKLVYNLAPRSLRLVAKLIDVVGGLVFLAAINYPLFVYTPKAVYDPVGMISIALYFGYFLFKDAWGGQSLGKRIVRIKVIEKLSGQPCTAPKSFLRNFFGALGIFDWVFIFGEKRMRLGDIAADTSVVWK